MIIQICVGSSCHLRGSEEIVKLFTKAIEKYKLDSEVTLVGNFCAAKCNRIGVTVTLDDVIHTGVTPENFNSFFEENVLKSLGKVE
ncbi:MAG: (2Fe-2S) ferredoxin domain-containing protein [Ruminococcus sp.]|nr:(2Fe-2S) ferredoxin domain-containing protein [Oscillospiraceae bacterium]